MSDKPKIHASLASLEVESAPEPFKFGLSGGKVVTFPDPGDMDWLDAETFMADIAGQPNSVVFEKWLSAEDFKKFKAEKLTLRQVTAISTAVGEHYRGIFGDSGEGAASTAS